jgi:hypothetical protein
MKEILILSLGIVIGTAFAVVGAHIISYVRNQKIRKKNNDVYGEVLVNLQNGKGKFISRINNIVQIDTKIKTEGKVSLLYFIDKGEVSIYKGNDCIFVSQNVDLEISNSIITMIWSRFSEKITDVVQIYNSVMDRKTFTKLMSESKSEVQIFNLDEDGNILNKVDSVQKLTLDDVLDRINEVGYDGLSQVEKDFLKNHK